MRLAKEMMRFLKDEDNPLGFSSGPNGEFRGGKSAFPELRSLGFVAWSAFDLGDGGETGFYWPLGMEDELPIVCSVTEEGTSLIPWASSFEAFLSLIIAQDPAAGEEDFLLGKLDPDEAREVAEFFHIELDDEITETCSDARSFLEMDSQSPFFLRQAGNEFMQRGDLTNALDCYQKALDTLPEYGDVAYRLAQLFKNTKRQEDLAYLLIDVLTSPLCLGADRPTALRQLQSLPEDTIDDTKEPLWVNRANLTFDPENDLKRNVKLYHTILEAYIGRDEGNQAVGWWIHVGGVLRALSKEQKKLIDFSEESFREEITEILQKVGFEERLKFAGATQQMAKESA